MPWTIVERTDWIMLCQDIINELERLAPPDYAMEWDNVGLLVGRRDKEVKKVIIAVDATEEVCDIAIEHGADMIITHHPMIFSKLNRINSDTALGRKLISLIEAGISCYAMHTNFDTIGGMGKLAAKMLCLKDTEVLEETKDGEGIGEIGTLPLSISLKELAVNVKDVFSVDNVMIFGDADKEIRRVAICPGSGKSVIDEAYCKGADCLVTGDIGHHEGIDAVDMGLTIIDASHYGIEKIFIKYISDYLYNYSKDIDIEEIDVGEPFVVI